MPSRLQDLLDGRGHVFVFTLNQARPHLDDGDFASKPPEHLPELQPDVAAAHDDQVPRKKVHAHHRAVGQVLHLVESRHRRHDRAPAHVDEDPLRREPVRAHADLASRFETRVALIDRAVLHLLQPGLDSRPRLPGDRVLPRLDAPHVDAHAAIDRHAEIRRAARHVRGIRARHHGLGRDAAGIDACAAEQLALDDRDLHACRGHALRERWPRLSRADDDRVEIARHENPPAIQTAPKIATASSSSAIGRSFPPVAFTSRVRTS